MGRVLLLYVLVGGCRETPETVVAPAVAPDATASVVAPSPLKLWMAANLARPMKLEDLDALEPSLALVAANAPPELPDWAAMAARGAAAAARGDAGGVRQSCNECHQKYRARYREQFRSRPFPVHQSIARSAP